MIHAEDGSYQDVQVNGWRTSGTAPWMYSYPAAAAIAYGATPVRKTDRRTGRWLDRFSECFPEFADHRITVPAASTSVRRLRL